MIHLLIGHRGVGKSSLLKRLTNYFPEALCFDLDEEIEKRLDRKIPNIFSEEGEEFFRRTEVEILSQLLKENHGKDLVYIALGAGYNQFLPEQCNCIWVKRKTDKDGRSFFNRPALDKSLSPLHDYLERYSSREQLYQSMANEVYLMPEGLKVECDEEKQIFAKSFYCGQAGLTLLRRHVRLIKSGRLNPNQYSFLELRDDLLSEEDLETCFDLIPSERILFSYRDEDRIQSSKQFAEKANLVDWPLELGAVKHNISPDILSLHARKDSLAETLEAYEGFCSNFPNALQKIAIPIYNFSELADLYAWKMNDHQKRQILPSSVEGKWNWFRNLMRIEGQRINFVNDGIGSSLDQMSLFEYLSFNSEYQGFLAVLGNPIQHSYSITEHWQNSQTNQLNFLSIQMDRKDLNFESVEFLKKLGFKGAAITSPLKEIAFELSGELSELAANLKSVNTWKLLDNKLFADNTDIVGLESLLSDLKEEQVLIWGGGGTLAPILEILPNAICYSAREGKPREGHKELEGDCVLIWASGEKGMKPSRDLKIKKIVDLSYTESSKGRELAVERKIEYKSGIDMFIAQAAQQKKIWYGSK
ncbi:MAG: shikimate kinase [Bdellovibrionota bacterium]|nr:shikimate kinase [Bdellovibrionota bacterium]